MAVGQFMKRAAERDYSKFWAEEGSFPWLFQQALPPITGRPISVRENYARCVRGEQPYWMPNYFLEKNILWPDAVEEHPVPEKNGFDWWGVDWYMEPGIGGMITKPGTRVISDFAEWKNEVEWPDLGCWLESMTIIPISRGSSLIQEGCSLFASCVPTLAALSCALFVAASLLPEASEPHPVNRDALIAVTATKAVSFWNAFFFI